MKIALVSLDQGWEDKIANELKCQDFIEKASALKADLIIFPEMTLTGFSMDTHFIKEKAEQSPSIEFFRRQAKHNNISIVFGIVLEKDDKATNNLIVVNSVGELLANYAKIHPFSFSGENNYYVGGDELVTCKIQDATVGLTICYDLRFPEIFQALSKSCDLIITIANWPDKRINHWISLLEARAIENQVFMVGVNRTGIDGNNLQYSKSSVVFDRAGERLKPINSYQDMDVYDIKVSDVQKIRLSFPVKQDRKTEFYKSIL